MQHLQGRRVGAGPGRAALHHGDVLGDPRPLRLHAVRQAGPGLRPVAVASVGVRASPPRRGAVPPRGDGQVHGVRRRLARQEPDALAGMPPGARRAAGGGVGDQRVPLRAARVRRLPVLVAVPRARRRDGPGRPDADRGGAVEPPPRRAGPRVGGAGARRRVRLRGGLGGELVLPPVRVPRPRPRRRLPRLPRAQRHRPHAPVLPADGVPDRAPRRSQVQEDGGRAHAVAVALRGRRRLRAGAAARARRVGDERGGEGHVRDTGGGVRGGEDGEQRGLQDAAARRHGGDGAAAGRAPEQVSPVAARQVQRVARLFALVPPRRHGRLQRHAHPHVVAVLQRLETTTRSHPRQKKKRTLRVDILFYLCVCSACYMINKIRLIVVKL